MGFDFQKDTAMVRMAKGDRSDKGSVDKPIEPLVNKFNSMKNYYTTSSCSGRVILLTVPASGKKLDSIFVFRTHDLASTEEVSDAVKNIDEDIEDAVWFRQEPAIIHVVTRELKDASKLLRAAREIGFKRSGLFEIDTRYIIELMSTEKIDTIIAKGGETLVSNEYIQTLVMEANKRLQMTWDKTTKLVEALNKFE